MWNCNLRNSNHIGSLTGRRMEPFLSLYPMQKEEVMWIQCKVVASDKPRDDSSDET